MTIIDQLRDLHEAFTAARKNESSTDYYEKDSNACGLARNLAATGAFERLKKLIVAVEKMDWERGDGCNDEHWYGCHAAKEALAAVMACGEKVNKG